MSLTEKHYILCSANECIAILNMHKQHKGHHDNSWLLTDSPSVLGWSLQPASATGSFALRSVSRLHEEFSSLCPASSGSHMPEPHYSKTTQYLLNSVLNVLNHNSVQNLIICRSIATLEICFKSSLKPKLRLNFWFYTKNNVIKLILKWPYVLHLDK